MIVGDGGNRHAVLFGDRVKDRRELFRGHPEFHRSLAVAQRLLLRSIGDRAVDAVDHIEFERNGIADVEIARLRTRIVPVDDAVENVDPGRGRRRILDAHENSAGAPENCLTVGIRGDGRVDDVQLEIVGLDIDSAAVAAISIAGRIAVNRGIQNIQIDVVPVQSNAATVVSRGIGNGYAVERHIEDDILDRGIANRSAAGGIILPVGQRDVLKIERDIRGRIGIIDIQNRGLRIAVDHNLISSRDREGKVHAGLIGNFQRSACRIERNRPGDTELDQILASIGARLVDRVTQRGR